MSASYENVVRGKLRLKGKPLLLKDGGIVKKKKKRNSNKHLYHQDSSTSGFFPFTFPFETSKCAVDRSDMSQAEGGTERGEAEGESLYLTPAERRYLQQWEKLDGQRMAKMASKSHRDRIHEFNQYLANLTEHYEIPKVGPG
ncbi:unnamed protein product [Linum tenue]|uniref:Protein FAM32A-like n=1 Tax=Linum tenue TaxID=586396 RepID=A0AAV0GV01_9ROSI|nr:unnamed protein product [Linum tenue]